MRGVTDIIILSDSESTQCSLSEPRTSQVQAVKSVEMKQFNFLIDYIIPDLFLLLFPRVEDRIHRLS